MNKQKMKQKKIVRYFEYTLKIPKKIISFFLHIYYYYDCSNYY